MSDDITNIIRSTLPDVESVLIVALCGGALLILLDSGGIDVIANLRESRISGINYIIYPVGLVVVSKAVERIREAFESETDVSEKSSAID